MNERKSSVGGIVGLVVAILLGLGVIFAAIAPSAARAWPGVSAVSSPYFNPATVGSLTFTGGGAVLSGGTAGEISTTSRIRADGGLRIGGVLVDITSGGSGIVFSGAGSPVIDGAGSLSQAVTLKGKTGNTAVQQTLDVKTGVTDVFLVLGTGITQAVIDGVSASNNLTGTTGGACAALGDVGKIVRYADTSTNKITFCACEQTGVATFAWGAMTAAGDCT